MITKELLIQFKSPILTMMGGFLTVNLTQNEYINGLLSDDFSLIKNIVALIGGALFFWKAYHGVSKSNREKDQAYEEKKIDIERKAWELAHEQKKANEGGLIEIIKELQETIKDSKK